MDDHQDPQVTSEPETSPSQPATKANKLAQRALRYQTIVPVLVIAVIAVVGVRMLSFSHAATQSDCNTTTYAKGSSGTCVSDIQTMVNYYNSNGSKSHKAVKVNGTYNTDTRTAVKFFQSNGITGYAKSSFTKLGSVDASTWTAFCSPKTAVGTPTAGFLTAMQAACGNTGPYGSENTFVTRSGSQLMLGGSPFRFAGANIYWLGLDDNIGNAYPSNASVNNALSEAVNMHMAVVRSHTLGISLGNSNSIEPSLGQFNQAAFAPIDYAIEQAGKDNLKLMIPLTDQWRYYTGGKWVFVHWAFQAGVPGVVDTNSNLSENAGNTSGAGSEKAAEAQFYTNPTIISYYEAYISEILNHKNQYTGVVYKDDPTIMAWETGNEIFDAPNSWTETIASYIKNTLGAKQLVADGSAAAGNPIANAALTQPDVDIVGDHFYTWPEGLDVSTPVPSSVAGGYAGLPPQGDLNDDAAIAKANNKVYIVGEYGWGLPGLSSFLTAIQNNPSVSGDMFWSILPYTNGGSSPESHNGQPPDKYGSGNDDDPLYVPGTDSTMNSDISLFTSHAEAMAGSN